MTRKGQIKIIDDKIKSNTSQYKTDRLNAEISAFLSGDLNKYEFLTRKDLKYKPNALDKARFEFSPLGKAFSTGLDKTVQCYQEEGVIKLLKDIRDGLAGGNSRDGRNDNDDDNDDDNDGNDKTFDLLNKFKNNMAADMHKFDKKYIIEENKWSAKLDRLNKNLKKLGNYIKENNNKKITTKKE